MTARRPSNSRVRVCSEPGCPEVLHGGDTRCYTHRLPERRTAPSQGYSSRWRRVRARYLHEHPLCECGCRRISTDVHHLDELGPRGPRGYDPANLVALAHGCHSRVTRAAQTRVRT